MVMESISGAAPFDQVDPTMNIHKQNDKNIEKNCGKTLKAAKK